MNTETNVTPERVEALLNDLIARAIAADAHPDDGVMSVKRKVLATIAALRAERGEWIEKHRIVAESYNMVCEDAERAEAKVGSYMDAAKHYKAEVRKAQDVAEQWHAHAENQTRLVEQKDAALREAQTFLAVVGASKPDDHEWVIESRRLCNAITRAIAPVADQTGKCHPNPCDQWGPCQRHAGELSDERIKEIGRMTDG